MRLLAPAIAVILCGTVLNAAAGSKWAPLTSKSGKVTVMAPGKGTKRVVKTKNIAGSFDSFVTQYKTDRVVFDVAFTPVPKRLLRLAGEKQLIKSAKGQVLSEASGKEISSKKITIDGVPAHLMEFEMPHPTDPDHKGYQGLALITLLDDGLFIASGVVVKEGGLAEIKRFRESIKIKK